MWRQRSACHACSIPLLHLELPTEQHVSFSTTSAEPECSSLPRNPFCLLCNKDTKKLVCVRDHGVPCRTVSIQCKRSSQHWPHQGADYHATCCEVLCSLTASFHPATRCPTQAVTALHVGHPKHTDLAQAAYCCKQMSDTGPSQLTHSLASRIRTQMA